MIRTGGEQKRRKVRDGRNAEAFVTSRINHAIEDPHTRERRDIRFEEKSERRRLAIRWRHRARQIPNVRGSERGRGGGRKRRRRVAGRQAGRQAGRHGVRESEPRRVSLVLHCLPVYIRARGE